MQEVATQVFIWEMAVWLEQRQFQPLLESQSVPSQLPIQSDHAQDGSHAKDEEANNAAAKAKDFMLTVTSTKIEVLRQRVLVKALYYGRRVREVGLFDG